MKDKRNFLTRVLFYIGGIMIIALGVGIAIKSDLGVSPVSSIPYTLDRVAGIETGNATILFNIFLVFVQIALLRKDFKPINFLQVLISFLYRSLFFILLKHFEDKVSPCFSVLAVFTKIPCLFQLFLPSSETEKSCPLIFTIRTASWIS